MLGADGEALGPVAAAQLAEMLEGGAIARESAVWSALLGEWGRLCDTPTLRGVWER